MTKPDTDRKRILAGMATKVRSLQDSLDYALALATLNEPTAADVLDRMTQDLQELIDRLECIPTPEPQQDSPVQPRKTLNSTHVDLDSLNTPHSTPDPQDKAP